jgi:shikimate kinase
MKSKNNIYLIGPMGSGKTSIGILLAKKTHKQFFDSDHEIEQRSGVSISWIFEIEKEPGFRKREEKIISELVQKKNIVLATGGGSVLLPESRKHLVNTGIVVYLKVTLAEQLRRTGLRISARPLADVPNREEQLAALNEVREPFYMEIADFVYQTHQQTPQEICNQILKDLELNDA